VWKGVGFTKPAGSGSAQQQVSPAFSQECVYRQTHEDVRISIRYAQEDGSSEQALTCEDTTKKKLHKNFIKLPQITELSLLN